MSKDKHLEVEAKLLLDKPFTPGTGSIQAGRYSIRPIPMSAPTQAEAVVSFDDDYREGILQASNPVGEVETLCDILSLLAGTHVRHAWLRIAKVDVPGEARQPLPGYSRSDDSVCLDDATLVLERTTSLPSVLAQQFVRACHAYALAVANVDDDVSLAFLLGVVAVECLSSQETVIPHDVLDKDSKKCERFCKFVVDNLPRTERGQDVADEAQFRRLLKTVYYTCRSAFVHGGRPASPAADIGASGNRSFITHYVDGKAAETPQVSWYLRCARGALLGYVRSNAPQVEADPHCFARMALARNILHLKARKPLAAGQAVRTGDVEL
ncbi:hypothetical protein JXD38_06160 [candidate division WOR-3 bacterium]|nr:hypothetical protein [candidate division WOR-3 bacterium]